MGCCWCRNRSSRSLYLDFRTLNPWRKKKSQTKTHSKMWTKNQTTTSKCGVGEKKQKSFGLQLTFHLVIYRVLLSFFFFFLTRSVRSPSKFANEKSYFLLRSTPPYSDWFATHPRHTEAMGLVLIYLTFINWHEKYAANFFGFCRGNATWNLRLWTGQRNLVKVSTETLAGNVTQKCSSSKHPCHCLIGTWLSTVIFYGVINLLVLICWSVEHPVIIIIDELSSVERQARVDLFWTLIDDWDVAVRLSDRFWSFINFKSKMRPQSKTIRFNL